MNKLKLDVHTLRVESFEPATGRGPAGGTVRGNNGEPVDDTQACSGDDRCTNADPCTFGESCAITACATCLCPHTGPQPSCDPCSWDGCDTYPPLC